MLQFVELKKETPLKRKVSNRNTDFNEIYNEFINTKAKEQSSRCSQCGVPFCQIHCPLSNNIPDWLKLTAEGRLEEAYELSQSTNNMPEVCGRICPQDRLCEGNCVIEQSGHGTVTIGSIEKHITDTAWTKGWVKPIKINNRRYYNRKNIDILLKIQFLLKDQGMTINGVKKILNNTQLNIDQSEKKIINSYNIKFRLNKINKLLKNLKE